MVAGAVISHGAVLGSTQCWATEDRHRDAACLCSALQALVLSGDSAEPGPGGCARPPQGGRLQRHWQEAVVSADSLFRPAVYSMEAERDGCPGTGERLPAPLALLS